VIHPMQYELEEAYHTTCEANASRQRQIKEAEHNSAADPKARRSVVSIVLQLWSRVMPALRAIVVITRPTRGRASV
jgi:hypothetical protein